MGHRDPKPSLAVGFCPTLETHGQAWPWFCSVGLNYFLFYFLIFNFKNQGYFGHFDGLGLNLTKKKKKKNLTEDIETNSKFERVKLRYSRYKVRNLKYSYKYLRYS
jgi:hypothetical protein